MPTKRRELPIVYVTRPVCPYCRGLALLTRRSFDQGDGTVMRYTRCRGCGAHFKVFVDLASERDFILPRLPKAGSGAAGPA